MADSQESRPDTRNPQAKELYTKAGELFEQNRFEEAIDLYSQAIKLDPVYSNAYFNRALSYAMLNRYENAKLDAQKVLELEPNSYDAPYVMGLICEYEGKLDEAKEWYERSLAKNPNYEQAKTRLAMLTAKLGQQAQQFQQTSQFSLGPSGTSFASSTKAEEEEETVIEEGQIKRVKWYRSNTTFKDVVDLKKQKELIYNNIILAIKKPELLKAYGKKLGLGVLFYGPPGNGKSYIVNAIAGETQSNVIVVRIHEIVDMYAGNTEKNLHAVFEQARKHTPCILFFDEIDALGMKREGGGDQMGYMRMAVNAFLTEMDGVEKNPEGIFVIGATNQPWDMDPALKRSGRFGERIYFPPPNYWARKAAFKYNTRNMPLGRINFGRLARATMGYSQADIAEICDKAALIPAVEEDRTGRKRKIKMKDFLSMIKTHGSTLDEWYAMIKKEIISKTETQIVEGKKTEIVKEGKLSPEEKVQYKDLVKDVKKNSSSWHRFIVKLVRFIALYLF
ncbi:MAG: AAA family ATPase [Candidatus Micrarchaeia archaeon]|jgi:ATP-dependent 26S proteasome regulatory subunit/Tfp pilus assembly protein PilF